MITSIWGVVQPEIGVAPIWLAFILDNLSFDRINHMMVQKLIVTSSSQKSSVASASKSPEVEV